MKLSDSYKKKVCSKTADRYHQESFHADENFRFTDGDAYALSRACLADVEVFPQALPGQKSLERSHEEFEQNYLRIQTTT